jgi:CheY-like chemotaxis protein
MPLSEVPPRLARWVPEGAELWKAAGCGQCTQTGYRGRFSVVELLVMSAELERLIGVNATADRIGQAAQTEGMRTLFECGLRHFLDGHTSSEELLRVADVPHDSSTAGRRAPDNGGGTAVADATTAATEADEELLAGLELLDEVPSAPGGAGSKRATILLVEDEDSLRRVMKDLLEQEGYTICEARDGAEAFEQVDRHNPDLVLLDLNLPNVDGYTVLAKLRSHRRTERLPVVVLSARGDEDNEVRALRLGATDFLTKPFRPRALSARLEATLARARA